MTRRILFLPVLLVQVSDLNNNLGVFATNVCFLPMWKIIPKYCDKKKLPGLLTMILTMIGALLAWFVAVFILGYLQVILNKIYIHIWLYSIILMACCVYIGVFLCTIIPPPSEKHKEKCCMKAVRSITVTLCVVGSCIIGFVGPLFFEDFFGSFPSIFSTSIVSVSFAQIALLPTGDVGPMILGGCCDDTG